MIQIIERFATQSPCWKTNVYQQSIGPDHPKADSRYQQYYASRHKLALHSLGCARASADYQSDKWNNPNNNSAIAHAVLDSNDGIARQNLRWDMRGWHCGNPGNNFMIGVEMCESDAIRYIGTTDKFEVLDMEKARRHCTTAYNGAVALFAELCLMFALDPAEDILSHKEAAAKGLAGAHTDPEHYWAGLGMAYTMDGFRADVAALLQQSQQEPHPEPAGFLGFPDVQEEDWYADALRWAVEHKVILQSGKPFNPDTPLTKATAIVLLRRLWNDLPDSAKSE